MIVQRRVVGRRKGMYALEGRATDTYLKTRRDRRSAEDDDVRRGSTRNQPCWAACFETRCLVRRKSSFGSLERYAGRSWAKASPKTSLHTADPPFGDDAGKGLE
jgi:hypothetical protein